MLCRYSSSRLPGKIMRHICGRPIIDYIVERITSVVSPLNMCVATSTDASDDIIEDYCREKGLNCYRGSLTDVAKRFLDAALANGWDYAVRINGDNFFVETNVLKHLMGKAITGQFDFLSNTHGKTFPQGMSVEIVKTSFYAEAYRRFSRPEDFEHVTIYLHKNGIGNYYFYDNETCPRAVGLKFAIDEEKDFMLCESLFKAMQGSHLAYNMKEIVGLYEELAK